MASRTPRRILVIDIGGTHIKYHLGRRGLLGKFASGPRMTPARMLRGLGAIIASRAYDAASIGYPGVVYHGRIAAEPHNLGKGWVGFDFQEALGCPVRVVNDAAMQAIGSYQGGHMLFLGLGTGLGVTLIVDGVVEPTELGHIPYKHGRTYEDYLGERGRRRRGNRKWRASVTEVVEHLRRAFEVDYVVLGGGNVKHLHGLPPGARLGDNRNAFRGGLRLWQLRGGRLPRGAAQRR
ncbi:MAG: ROK family protein [Gammaproteobacteria bacterium]|nr:ROK family protein [Gammaproteobacteria bacterium]